MKRTVIAVAILLSFMGCAASSNRYPVLNPQYFHKELSVEVRENGEGQPQVIGTFKITN